jgi:hypothetical protein
LRPYSNDSNSANKYTFAATSWVNGIVFSKA